MENFLASWLYDNGPMDVAATNLLLCKTQLHLFALKTVLLALLLFL